MVAALALILIGKVQIERALHRAALTEAINTARSVKFALDGFATDFDGQYPTDETGERVLEGGLGDEYSNDCFRQLFITGKTQSETIFWIKGSPVAGKAIMLLIDETIKVSRLNDHHRIVDGSNEDIFSRSAVAWEGDRGEPEEFLVQPELASDKR